MHAVQSALAIRRERERRQSLKDQLKDGKNNGRKSSGASMPGPMGGNAGPGVPSGFRSSETSNGTFNYTTVGICFIIFGSLMLIPIMAGGSQMLGEFLLIFTQYGQSQSEKKADTSQLLLPQHQSTYPRGPESIEIPPFRPHFIKFSKTVFY